MAARPAGLTWAVELYFHTVAPETVNLNTVLLLLLSSLGFRWPALQPFFGTCKCRIHSCANAFMSSLTWPLQEGDVCVHV